MNIWGSGLCSNYYFNNCLSLRKNLCVYEVCLKISSIYIKLVYYRRRLK
jgi:hypothetical protein